MAFIANRSGRVTLCLLLGVVPAAWRSHPLASQVTYSDELIVRVQTIIDMDEREHEPMEKFRKIMTILKENGIVYRVECVSAMMVLVHCKNRGGLGLNGHQAHDTALRYKYSGVDVDEVNKNSVCMELCPFEPLRSMNLKLNQDCVERAKGLLADLLGHEKYLSLGAGHFTAFVRAVLQRCTTPHKELSDPDGRPDASKWHGVVTSFLKQWWEGKLCRGKQKFACHYYLIASRRR